MRRTHRIAVSAIAASVACAWSGIAMAAVVIDGSMSPGEGYTLDSVQINPTSSPDDSNGGPQGPSTEVNASSTGNFTQLSNAYSYVDTSANTLNLFIGGSIYTADAGVSHYIIVPDQQQRCFQSGQYGGHQRLGLQREQSHGHDDRSAQ